jgi:hypothetical protein
MEQHVDVDRLGHVRAESALARSSGVANPLTATIGASTP